MLCQSELSVVKWTIGFAVCIEMTPCAWGIWSDTSMPFGEDSLILTGVFEFERCN